MQYIGSMGLRSAMIKPRILIPDDLYRRVEQLAES
jgi:hypothetical protein